MIVADLPGPVSALLAGILPDATPGDLVEIAIAGAVAAAVFALAWRWRKRAWPAALALAAGYTTGPLVSQTGLASPAPLSTTTSWWVSVKGFRLPMATARLSDRPRVLPVVNTPDPLLSQI